MHTEFPYFLVKIDSIEAQLYSLCFDLCLQDLDSCESKYPVKHSCMA